MPRTGKRTLKIELRPELELIVCCARTRLDPIHRDRIRELLAGRLNWTDIIATSIQHTLESLVFENVTGAGGDLLQPIERAMLHAPARDTGISGLALLNEMILLYELFEAERIPVIPYKGPLLSWLAYHSLTRRRCVDLDFAVPQRFIPQTTSLMQVAGYRPEFDLREAHDGQKAHAPGQYAFFSNVRDMSVELHTERTLRYFPVPLDFAEMEHRRITVDLAGRKLHTFSIEDTLVMLCVHGAKHFWERLGWIADIAELIQAQPVVWPQALRIAKELKSTRLLLLGLYLAHGLLAAPLPSSILEQAQQDSNVRWLANQVCNQLAGKSDPSTGVLPRAAFRLRSGDKIGNGIRHMLRLATSPTETDRQSIRLPRVLAPFYALVRPWRLLREYGFGFRQRLKPDLAIYDPTPQEVVDHMLHLASVGPGDILYDLGCGDGRIVVTAAERYGIRAVGVDVSPQRIAEAQAKARRHGVESRVQFLQQDAKKVEISEATVVTMYLGTDANLRLVERLRTELLPGARIVSRNFQIYGWAPERLEKHTMPNGIPTFLYFWRIPKPAEQVERDSRAEYDKHPAGESDTQKA